MAAAVTLAASCQKEIENNVDNTPVVSENAVVFTATSEDAQSKTTIENGTGAQRIVKWAAGDLIDIFWDGGSTSPAAKSAGSTTTFEAEVDAASDYFAVYPSGAGKFDTGVLSITVPSDQDGQFASANIAVATTTAADKTFNFYNASALVKFTIADAAYTKAVFKGAKGEVIAGTAPVTFATGDIALGAVAENEGKEITVNLSGAGDYYFAVLPIDLTEGFAITLYKGADADTPCFLTSDKNLTRSHILNLGNVEGRGVTNFFATPTGAGSKSGKNWENAMDAAALKAFIEQPLNGTAQDDAQAFYKAAILDGSTIHMAAGDYYLAGAAGEKVKVEFHSYPSQVAITFKGGYPAGLTGTSLAGRTDPVGSEAEPANCTAFTGNGEAGILLLGNQTNVTFEGITFKDASFTVNDAALSAVAGSSGDATLTVSKCRFVNNANDADHTGAGIALGKSDATIDHCFFGGNSARNGSAITLNSGNGTVVISNCLFKGNNTGNTSGALQNGSPKTVTVTNCTFQDNTAGSWGGGAFHSNGEGVSTSFNSCTFTGNSAPQGGAVSIEKAEAIFTDCVFSNNSATKGDQTLAGQGQAKTAVSGNAAGGAIILHNAAAVCTLNNCSFDGNTAPNGCGGAIAFDNASATLNVNAGTSFTDNTAYFHGGAIFGLGGFTVSGTSASKVLFTGDKTLATGNQHSNGGAIFLAANTTSAISYAVFEDCEAGQEDGSTVNYSNGGAISTMAVTSLLVDHCEFTECRGRNGGCLNIEPGTSSTVKFSDCNFHDNSCRSGASKNGTGGNFHGAVARIGGSGTVEFERCDMKDNTAYNGSGALHINVNGAAARLIDCSLSGNYCENGVGGAITLEYGSLYMSGCTVSDNHVVSGSTVRNGGALYLDSKAAGQEPSLEAVNCTFSGNYINGSGNAFGGVMRVQGNSDISFTDCVFDGNHSRYRGGIFGLNSSARLKMDNCVVKNNYAASGGMIQCGANCMVFLNRVVFYNNYTTASGGWGINIHSGDANVCMNNVTSFDNHCTNENPGNCVSFNSDGGWLITNSTIIDRSPLAAVRGNGNSRKVTVCNDIILNESTADNVFVLKVAGNYNDLGHNLLSFTTAPSSPTLAATDLIGFSHSTLGGSFNTTSNAYVWTNSLTGFTPATQTEVENAMKTGYPETDSVHTGISNIGLEFYNWLSGIGALGKDGRGTARVGDWWPGAYQQN